VIVLGDYVITPAQGVFDVEAMRGWLDARIDAYEDPREAGQYVLGGAPSEVALENRLAGDRHYGATIFVSPQQVFIFQFTWADKYALRSALDFVVWLTKQASCVVRVNGYGNDLTEQLHRDGAESLYDRDIVETPHLWDGKLVRVGFFWEPHDFGAEFQPSLAKACRPEAAPDEAEVVRYLEAGRLYEQHDEIATDYFDDDAREIGPSNLLTDGFYVWPADFAYYVRTYHVHVPRAFVMHAKHNAWRVPEVDVASLPELAF
jgi:hypothetical protein